MDEPSHSEGNDLNSLQSGMQDFRVAGLFLTRLPFQPKGDLQTQDLARASRCFPLIGLLIGAISGAVFMMGAELNLYPLACAFLAITAGALVTGALHEDGLADVVDGFGGGHTKEDKLRVMRDSHIGAYGVLALILSVGLRASILAGLLGPGMATVTLVGAAVLSRSLLPGMMYLMPRSRTDGLAAGAGRPTFRAAIIAFCLGSLIAWPFLGGGVAIVALICALISALIMAFIAHRQIGGYTGDVLGATQQITEIAILMTAGAFAL
jgi:adenosylcobinamide-GDP ribazoletransferase